MYYSSAVWGVLGVSYALSFAALLLIVTALARLS